MIRIHTLLGLFLVAATAYRAQAAPPNILFLHADDQRPDTIAALGNPAIHTPTLDALASRGLAFQNAYNFGGNSGAVCTPSRNMMLSGKTFFHYSRLVNPKSGDVFRPDAKDPAAAETVAAKMSAGYKWDILAPAAPPNFPTSLAAAGYQTYHHGKKGNTATHIQACFEINKYLKDDQAERLNGEPGKEIVDEAITFLEARSQSEQAQARPFFMYLAFGNPHDPRVAAEEYRAQYKTEAIPLPKNYLPVHPFNNGELTVRDERLAPWPRTEAEIRKQLHDYYATITAFDHHLGRLMETVRDLKLDENTIVIFSADQGLAMGSHGLMGKQNLYEHSTRSPLVIAGPKIPGGRTGAMVYLMDIYPTVCELVGAATPEGIDGRSFAKVVRGEATTHRDAIFCAYQGVQRVLRDERYKLIRYPRINRSQLFDLVDDPDELNDLADQPAQKERVNRMLAAMKTRQKEFGDWMPLSTESPDAEEFDYKNVGPAEPRKKRRN
jgi:arylsulfatase A-like enzyme